MAVKCYLNVFKGYAIGCIGLTNVVNNLNKLNKTNQPTHSFIIVICKILFVENLKVKMVCNEILYNILG